MRQTSERFAALLRRLEPLANPRLLRALIPLVPILALGPWILHELGNELDAPLFRDAAMIQYTGWCIRHGLRLYKDVATPDGPFIHFFHALLQVFWGITDAGARKGDILFHLFGSMTIGFVLAPRTHAVEGADGAKDIARTPTVVVWTLLGPVVWLPWYFTGGWEQTVQRVPYYALVGYLGMILVYKSGSFTRRWALTTMAIAGFLLALEPFTRHSGIAYPGLALVGLLMDWKRPFWKERIAYGLYGTAAGIVFILLLLVFFGSLSGFGFWYFSVPFKLYKYIGTHQFGELYTHVYGPQVQNALVILIITLVAVSAGLMPVSIIGMGATPFVFVVAACMVGKGWPNHVQQAAAALNLMIFVGLSEAWQRGFARKFWRSNDAVLAGLLGASLIYTIVSNLTQSPFNANVMGYDTEHVTGEQVAADLARSTGPDDRVFYYSHELHGLLLAERKPAVPAYTDMLVNFGAWFRHEAPWRAPTPEQMDGFKKVEAVITNDSCNRLLESPPAALAVQPHDFNIWSVPSFESDMQTLCPEFAKKIPTKYTSHAIGSYLIYLRNDLPGAHPAASAPAPAPIPSSPPPAAPPASAKP